MRLPSASRVGLAAHCLYPWTSDHPWDDGDSPAAAFGRAVHACAELLPGFDERQIASDLGIDCDDVVPLIYALAAHAHGLSEADAKRLPMYVSHISGVVLEAGRTACVRAEVAIAYDVMTMHARCAARGEVRDRSRRGPDEMILIIDLLVEGAQAWAINWKTGRSARYEHPRDSPQLRAEALAVYRLLGRAPRASIGAVDEDGVIMRSHDFTTWELDTIAAELMELRRRQIEEPSVPRPGMHCRDLYCPMVSRCPATRGALAAVDRPSELPMPLGGIAIRSDEHLRSVRERVALIEEGLPHIKRAMREYLVKRGAVEVTPGVYYGPVEHKGRERVDLEVPGATEVVERHLGPEAAKEAVEVSASKTSLARGVRAAAEVGQRAAMERALLGELRAVGAIKEGSPYVTLEEFRKDEQ